MTYTDKLNAAQIAPVHEVREPEKLAKLTKSMASSGWRGRPLLVLATGCGITAWTGSHRLVAARALGLQVPCLVMEPPSVDAWLAAGFDEDALFGEADDDEGRLEQLRSLPGYEDAAELMQEEIDRNTNE